MDFYGLDMLGAITVSPKKEKAAAAGRRALAAAQKVAKRLPRLSKAISSAGQKALKVAGSGSTAAPSPVKKADAAKPAPSPLQQQKAPQPQQKPMQGRPQGPALRPQPQPVKAPTKAPPLPSRGGPAKRGTKLGEEQADEGTDQQADIYTQLADAAAGVVDFLACFQGLLDRIPQNLPLYQKGVGTISQFENWFAAPIEAALQGDQAALAKAPDIYGLIEYFKEQGEATGEKRWPWDWASLAETYLKLHPGAEAPAEPGAGPVADEAGTAPSGAAVSNVAKVVVSPTGMTVPIGGAQLFRVDTLDAKNKVVTSQSPITWSASGGATIDPSGNFTAQSAGTYTITASVDGVTGTATAIVQAAAAASPAASPSAPYSGGGGDYGGGGYSGGDYADSGSQDSGGGEYTSYDGGYAEPAEPEYGEQEMYSEADQGQVFEEEHYSEGDGELDDPFYGATVEELGAIVELGKGGGGKGGGKGGGHHHHHKGGGRRFEGGGPWYYGPWWPSYGIEINEPFDEPTVDDLAEVIAEKLAEKKMHASVGLDCLGALADDSADYDHGERLLSLMYNQYVNLGSPGDFQGQASALWSAYNGAKVGLFGSKWASATKMKNLGIEAHRLLVDMQRAYPAKMRITLPPATLEDTVSAPPGAVSPLPALQSTATSSPPAMPATQSVAKSTPVPVAAADSDNKPWLMRPIIGPVPGWGIAVAGVGGLGLIAKLAYGGRR